MTFEQQDSDEGAMEQGTEHLPALLEHLEQLVEKRMHLFSEDEDWVSPEGVLDRIRAHMFWGSTVLAAASTIIPRLAELVDEAVPDVGEAIVKHLADCAIVAHHALPDEHARAAIAVLAGERERFAMWPDEDVDRLRAIVDTDAWLMRVLVDPTALQLLLLGKVARDRAYERARSLLGEPSDPPSARRAAAALLVGDEGDPDTLERVRAALGEPAIMELLPELEATRTPRPRPDAFGLDEWHHAEVLVASAYWLRVRIADAEHMSRWPTGEPPPVTPRVRVTFRTDGSLHRIEHRTADGATVHVSL